MSSLYELCLISIANLKAINIATSGSQKIFNTMKESSLSNLNINIFPPTERGHKNTMKHCKKETRFSKVETFINNVN